MISYLEIRYTIETFKLKFWALRSPLIFIALHEYAISDFSQLSLYLTIGEDEEDLDNVEH